ncbi:MAG: flippase [Bacteroidota bacterium]
MTTFPTVAKNFFSLFFSNVVQGGLQIIFIALFARHVGAIGFGQYSYALSIVLLFNVLVNYGFDSFLVREIAKEKERATELVGKSLLIKGILAILVTASLGAYFQFQVTEGQPEMFLLVIILAFATFVETFSNSFTSLFRAFERMELEAAANIVAAIIYVGAGVGVILFNGTLHQIVLALCFAPVVKIALVSCLCRKKFPVGAISKYLFLDWTVLKSASVFAVLGGIGIVYSNADRIILGRYLGYEAVGYYSSAYKVITLVITIPMLSSAAIYPVVSRSFASSEAKAAETYSKSYRWLLMVGALVGFLIYLLGGELINLLYGPDFSTAGMMLKILSPFVAWQFPNYINGQTMTAIGKERLFSVTYGLATALNIGLNFWLIPRVGYMGVCYSAMIPTAVGFIFYSWYCHRQFRISYDFGLISKVVFALFILVFLSFFVHPFGKVGLWSYGVLSPLLYLMMLGLFRTFSHEDRETLKQVVASTIFSFRKLTFKQT